jgi:hypothetical protein
MLAENEQESGSVIRPFQQLHATLDRSCPGSYRQRRPSSGRNRSQTATVNRVPGLSVNDRPTHSRAKQGNSGCLAAHLPPFV